MTERCDYLVIGGGAAGCILARRLAADPGTRVLLLEAGPVDEDDPLATDLSRLEEQDERYDWGYRARPTPQSAQQILYNRAKMLGGCANHNDCAFLVPPPRDFANWVELGADGWDFASLVPAFKRIEEQLHIEASPPGNALSRAFIDACIETGLPERDFRRQWGQGAGWFPLNVKGSLRQSSSVAYLHPLAALPPNLEVRCHSLVTRLIAEHGRIAAVECDGERIEVDAEVVLCAGSINTPQLMMVSGLGPGSELQRLGIPVIVDLPGVGQNLLDHVAANIACELHAPPPAWALTPCEATALVKVHADAPDPDVLFHFVLMLREKYTDADLFGDAQNGIKLSPNVARPKSRGWLQLTSADIREAPAIELNYFSDPEGYDEATLIAGLRFALEILAGDALQPWIKRELLPGPDVVAPEDFRSYIRETCETVYHPSGTCRIGRAQDRLAVVGPDLRVRGIDGLRVADASVFPDMVTVNICNTVMMVAERAAELMRQS